MNINRNNYETFFLLYVDGEMSPQEMLEVDAFCQKHPDLADELQLLMDTRLSPEADFALPNKDALLKLEEWDADHLTSEQLALLEKFETSTDTHTPAFADPLTQKEWSLLQQTQLDADTVHLPNKHQLIKALLWDADNLTSQQLQLLEALELGEEVPAALLSDPEWQKDWLLLQQTQMQPEQLVMPNKQRLYRHEETAPATPVVRMNWWRYAAAAAVVAGIGWFVFGEMSNGNNEVPPQLSQQKNNVPVITTPAPAIGDTLQPGQQPVQQAPVQMAANNRNETPVAAKAVVKQATVPSEEKQDIAANIAAYRIGLSEEQALRARASNDSRYIDNPDRAPISARDYMNTPDALAANSNNKSVQIDNAVVMEEMEEDEYINIGGARIKSQKLRGVLRTVSRKVTRGFDKSTVAPAETAAAELK